MTEPDDGASTSAAREPRTPTVCVVAPTPQLSVTIEAATPEAEPEVHVHPAGQGVWIGRMAVALGAGVVLCAPFGGEVGDLVAHLAGRERMTVRATRYTGPTGSYVHDRRAGDRAEVARTRPPALSRHEVDDLYGTVLVEALDSDVVVLTGDEPAGLLEPEFFTRLATDLREQGRTVVGDLSGDVARAVLEPGIDVLKMSHSELVEAGFASGADLDDLHAGAREVLAGGVRTVVVSRADDPTLVVAPDGAYLVVSPHVSPLDHRGAGDSMTAGIAVGVGRGWDLPDAVRLGAAAGALNATRHGLGSGRAEQIERFAQEVQVQTLD